MLICASLSFSNELFQHVTRKATSEIIEKQRRARPDACPIRKKDN
jgi:hypothetical protein